MSNSEQTTELEKWMEILKFDCVFKKLKELPMCAVNVKTENEYNMLMKIYEKGGWEHKKNYWHGYKERTTIDCMRIFKYASIEFNRNDCGFNIISLQEFIEIQNAN